MKTQLEHPSPKATPVLSLHTLLTPLKIAAFLAAERFAHGETPREPEPDLVMSSDEQVESFDREGASHGVLVPVYHVNAVLLSQVLPANGRLLDLGCGSGRLLLHLAKRRPDIRIVGLDASHGMIERARQLTRERGLDDRLTFLQGDMMRAADHVPIEEFSAISTVFALHHLPTYEALTESVASLCAASSAAIHVFDFARPRRRRSAERFPAVFSPQASRRCGEDTTNSMLAAFSLREIRAALVNGDDVESVLSWPLPIYQVHRRVPAPLPETASLWRTAQLSPDERAMCRLLRRSFRALAWPDYD